MMSIIGWWLAFIFGILLNLYLYGYGINNLGW